MWSLLLGAIVVALVIVIAWAPKVGKTYGNKRQTFSASGLFFIKRHPTKYMHIEKKEPTTL